MASSFVWWESKSIQLWVPTYCSRSFSGIGNTETWAFQIPFFWARWPPLLPLTLKPPNWIKKKLLTQGWICGSGWHRLQPQGILNLMNLRRETPSPVSFSLDSVPYLNNPSPPSSQVKEMTWLKESYNWDHLCGFPRVSLASDFSPAPKRAPIKISLQLLSSTLPQSLQPVSHMFASPIFPPPVCPGDLIHFPFPEKYSVLGFRDG